MCGLVGVAGDLTSHDEKIMKRLLVLDYFRGTDSTGIAKCPKHTYAGSAMPVLAKLAVNPFDFFDHKDYSSISNSTNSLGWIGHNRAATLGKVNSTNAHPFRRGNIIGAHNGTLEADNYKEIQELLGEETGTDSEAIFACIDQLGIEDTIKILREGRYAARGAWALTFFDIKEKTLNIIRNPHRPLWFSFSKDYKTIYWASEYPMIRAAIELQHKKCAREVLAEDKDGHMFFGFAENYLYTLDLQKLAAGGYKPSKEGKMPSFRAKKLEGKQPKPVAASNTNYCGMGANHFGFGYDDDSFLDSDKTTPENSSRNTTASQTTSGSDSGRRKYKGNVINMTVEGNGFGPVLSLADFESLAAHRCSFCDAEIRRDDPSLVIIPDEHIILCGGCNHKDTTRVYLSMKEMDTLQQELEASNDTKH